MYRQLTRTAMLVLAGGLGAACSTSTPDPQNMVRTTTATAPADLQLLCAGAAATAAGVPGDKVLPVASAQIDANNYQVELNAAGQRHLCVVTAAGAVVSVQKV